jgi:uncharacterized protein involved in exopolysaccharide biosynthesis
MNNARSEMSDRPNAAAPYGQEISLSELLSVLVRYWLVVLGVAVVAGIVAFVISANTTPVYEASSKLLMRPAKLPDDSRPPISAATFQTLISNQSLILEVLKELGLTEPPYRLTPAEALQRNLAIEARGNDVIVITARFDNAALAAQLTSRLAERSIRVAEQVLDEDLKKVKAQVDHSLERLENAEARLLAFRKQAQLEAITAEVHVLVDERAKLLPLLVQIEAERARIRQITQELERYDVRSDRRGDEPPVTRESAGAQHSQPLTGHETERAGGTVYEALTQQLADSRTSLSELESQRAEILRVTDMSKAGAKKLNDLYTRQAQVDRLSGEVEAPRAAYLKVAEQYDQLRSQIVSNGSQLQVVDVAVPPGRPISPRPRRNAAVGLLVGAVLASAAVLLYGATSGRREPSR